MTKIKEKINFKTGDGVMKHLFMIILGITIFYIIAVLIELIEFFL